MLLVVGAGSSPPGAGAADVQHGMAVTKGCASPTAVYAKFACSYSVRNIADEARDRITVFGLTDVVHTTAGDRRSGDVFRQLKLYVGPLLAGFSDLPTCTGVGMTGNGTVASPWAGATSCTLPFGSSLNVQSFAWYTVQPSDLGRPLTNDVYVDWHDLCTGVSNNCNPNPPAAVAASMTAVTQNASTTTTEIHGATHAAVTTVAAGSIVHDLVTVKGDPGLPPPTGSVRLDWFTNSTCTGEPAATSAAVAVGSGGTLEAQSFPQGPLPVGSYGFRAHFLGDLAYAPSDGPCEPLQVVDANIRIAPPSKDNPVGTIHVLTITVNAVGGTLAAGRHTATASIQGGDPGSFVAARACTYTGGGATASCTVAITSGSVGTTHVSAASDIAVDGITITRATATDANSAAGGSGNAVKNWLRTARPNPAIRTDVHDEQHAVITFVDGRGPAVELGETVHDKAFVRPAAGAPASAPVPGGKVVFHRYATSDCTGSKVEDETVALAADGTAESEPYTVATDTSYRADYLGDPTYASAVGICERLRPLFLPPPGLTIAKCPLRSAVPCVKRDAGDPRDRQEVVEGGTARFRIVVTNTSAFALVDVTVTDPLSPGCGRALGTMAAGTQKEYVCTRPEVEVGYVNFARVVGTTTRGPRANLRDADPSSVQVPAIEIAKCRLVPVCGKGRDDQQTEGARLTAEFRITVENTGGVALHDVTVGDLVAPECARRKSGFLKPGQSWTYTCRHTRTAAVKTGGDCGYLNVATVVGTSDGATNVRDRDSSSVQHPSKSGEPPPCGTG